VSRILSSFGLIQGAADKLGWLAEGAAAGSGSSSGNSTQLLDALAALRDEVRSLVRGKAEPQQILDACSKVSGGCRLLLKRCLSPSVQQVHCPSVKQAARVTPVARCISLHPADCAVDWARDLPSTCHLMHKHAALPSRAPAIAAVFTSP
jgi:hypothetical protein